MLNLKNFIVMNFPKFSPAAQKIKEIWLKDLRNSQNFRLRRRKGFEIRRDIWRFSRPNPSTFPLSSNHSFLYLQDCRRKFWKIFGRIRIFNKFRIFAFRIFRIFHIFWREKFRIPHFAFYFLISPSPGILYITL